MDIIPSVTIHNCYFIPFSVLKSLTGKFSSIIKSSFLFLFLLLSILLFYTLIVNRTNQINEFDLSFFLKSHNPKLIFKIEESRFV